MNKVRCRKAEECAVFDILLGHGQFGRNVPRLGSEAKVSEVWEIYRMDKMRQWHRNIEVKVCQCELNLPTEDNIEE